MIVAKRELPKESVLKNEEGIYDYIDSFQSEISEKRKIGLTELGELFFAGSSPRWVEALMGLRNKIVKVFGLKTSDDISDSDNWGCDKGDRLGLFDVFDRTENELILGKNDKHLDFKVSLLFYHQTDDSKQKIIALTTLVKYNNCFGKLYFFPVQFFHRLIVQSSLQRIVSKLENESI